MTDWERTAEEREAARLERERMRAEQSAYDGEPFADDGDAEIEVPLGTRRVARRDRPSAGRLPRARPRTARGSTAAKARPRRPREGTRRTATGRRKHSLLGRILSLVALAVGAAVIWFLVELFQPFQGSGHGKVTVTVPQHEGARAIGDLLARDHVITSGFFFDVRAMLAGDRGKLLSGTYHLKLGMSYSDVLKILTTPPPPAKVSELTIVEGRTRGQIDALLRAQHIPGSYVVETRHSPLLDPRQYGAPANTPTLEGFLFPSTYQLRDPISIAALVRDQLTTFKARFSKVDLGYARSRHQSPYDVLIIASMVQAEAEVRGDFPLVASVIYNRLKDHMPLGIDATTRYATGNYTRPLTQSELNSPSPYNTRNHVGLAPTPIDNPGMEAIDAAAHPANTSYLYFVVKPCGNGAHVFASSYTQFLNEVQQYYSARSRQGGKSPAHC